MKIAISGSAGCGKSTLAQSLSQELGIELIPESYDDFFDSKGKYIRPRERLMGKIEEVLDAKHELENNLDGFVADRSPIDLFNFWLTQGFSSNSDKSEQIQDKCKDYLQKYNLIIFPPWGALPLKQVDEEHTKRRRVMKPWVQFRHHSTLIGIALQWVPVSKILPIPTSVGTPEQRLDFVLKAIKR